MAKDVNTLRPVEAAVVVPPTTYHGVDELREVLQALVVPSGGQTPLTNGGANRVGGLCTDGRKEANEAFPLAILGPTRLEGVPEEIKRAGRPSLLQ